MILILFLFNARENTVAFFNRGSLKQGGGWDVFLFYTNTDKQKR